MELRPSTVSATSRVRAERDHATHELLSRLNDPSAGLDDTERQALVDRLIEVNVPLARWIAGRFAGRGCDLEDLEQTACVALVQAVQRYDPTTGHHFLSYVVPCITGEVKRHFRDRGWMVRPPRPVQELQPLIDRERLRIDPRTGRPPGDVEVAERLGVPVARVQQALLARGCFTPSSLDEAATGTAHLSVGDTLRSPRAEREFLAAEARAMLAPAMDALDVEERRLVQMRFVDELSQVEIGVALGVSQSHVSRLVREILVRLRRDLEQAPAASPPLPCVTRGPR